MAYPVSTIHVRTQYSAMDGWIHVHGNNNKNRREKSDRTAIDDDDQHNFEFGRNLTKLVIDVISLSHRQVL